MNIGYTAAGYKSAEGLSALRDGFGLCLSAGDHFRALRTAPRRAVSIKCHASLPLPYRTKCCRTLSLSRLCWMSAPA